MKKYFFLRNALITFYYKDKDFWINLLNNFLNCDIRGANFSHTVVFRPVRTGIYNFTAAEVTYQTSEDSQEVQVHFFSKSFYDILFFIIINIFLKIEILKGYHVYLTKIISLT